MAVQRNINDDITMAYLLQKPSKALDKAVGELEKQIGALWNLIYPVGAIYLSTAETSPASLFGGTWERITGRFLLGATDDGAAGGNSNANIEAGGTGGEATHTLNLSEAPSHSHTVNSHSHSQNVWVIGMGANKKNYTAPNASTLLQTVAKSSTGRVGGIYDLQTHGWANPDNYAVGNSSPGTNAQGGGGAHNNMPPYLSVYMWERIE